MSIDTKDGLDVNINAQVIAFGFGNPAAIKLTYLKS